MSRTLAARNRLLKKEVHSIAPRSKTCLSVIYIQVCGRYSSQMHFASVRSSFGSMGKEVSLTRIFMYLRTFFCPWAKRCDRIMNLTSRTPAKRLPPLQVVGVRQTNARVFLRFL